MKHKTVAVLTSMMLSTLTGQLARADPARHAATTVEDLLARVDGMPSEDPRPYEQPAGPGLPIIAFKTSSPEGGYLCFMWEESQGAHCESVPTEDGRRGISATALADEDVGSASIGVVYTARHIAGLLSDAKSTKPLPDRHKITFDEDGSKIECWAAAPVVGCRTAQEHGFALYNNGGQAW